VVLGQPRLRSVDSEGAGCVIEPRNREIAGADVVSGAEGNTGGAEWPGVLVPPGSDESRACAERVRRELGRSCHLRSPEVAALEESSMPPTRGRQRASHRGREGKAHHGTGGRGDEPPGTGDRKSERLVVPTRPGNRA
jgi:hypothetical protein